MCINAAIDEPFLVMLPPIYVFPVTTVDVAIMDQLPGMSVELPPPPLLEDPLPQPTAKILVITKTERRRVLFIADSRWRKWLSIDPG